MGRFERISCPSELWGSDESKSPPNNGFRLNGYQKPPASEGYSCHKTALYQPFWRVSIVLRKVSRVFFIKAHFLAHCSLLLSSTSFAPTYLLALGAISQLA